MKYRDALGRIAYRAPRLTVSLAVLTLCAADLGAQQSPSVAYWHVGVAAGYVFRGGDQFRGRTNSASVGAVVGHRNGRVDLQGGVAYSRHCNPDPVRRMGTGSLGSSGLVGDCADSEPLIRIFVGPRYFLSGPSAVSGVFFGGHLGFVRRGRDIRQTGGELGVTGGYVLRLGQAITLDIGATASAVYLGDVSWDTGSFAGSAGWASLVNLWVAFSVIG